MTLSRREFLIRIGQVGAAAAIATSLPWPDPTELGHTIVAGSMDFVHKDGWWCFWTGWQEIPNMCAVEGSWCTVSPSTMDTPAFGHELRAVLSAHQIDSAASFDIKRLAREQARLKFIEYLDTLQVAA